ncbi:MAG: hypothetical protein AMJ56_07655 [Anaerolineae bacterium SG8_19]|nr:MAG: hypothetical protein AMJ56_07655 [Anaerolineae bacterium SG8_19]
MSKYVNIPLRCNLISIKEIERMEIEGPMEDRSEILDSLGRAGWSVIRSGPRVEDLKADITIFHVIAERETK